MKETMADKLRGGLWGVVVGDAFGLPFQFRPGDWMKDEYSHPSEIPVIDGIWSDDSSLTLATAHALTEGYGLGRIAHNFIEWLYDGKFTPRGFAFDEGRTTTMAIERLAKGVPPLKAGGNGEYDNGNGSLMRILPAAYYAYFKRKGIKDRLQIVHEVSMLTHAHPRSLVGCGVYSLVVWGILSGMGKFEAYEWAVDMARDSYSQEPFRSQLNHYERLLSGEIHNLERQYIRGSGYIVHTLEASMWSFLRNDKFEDAVRDVVYLGEDTDTTGAVVGGLAGTYLGFEAIPSEWFEMIEAKDVITAVVEPFIQSLS